MDAILSTFISAFQNGAANLQGRAMGLLFTLMTIDFFLAVIRSLGQGGTNYFSLFLQKLFPYGAIIYMISNYAFLVNVVMEGFLQIGQIVGGTNLSNSPEEVFGKGVDLFTTALENISEDENLTFMNVIKGEAGAALFTAIAAFFGYLGILICFSIIALQMAICYIEFYLGVAYLIIFLPFLVFKPMAFLGEKAIGFIIGFGVKYMVLISIVGVALQSIDGLVEQAAAEPSLVLIFTVLGAAALIAYLAWQAPSLAAGIMSGGPSLTAGTMVHSGLALGSAAAGYAAKLFSNDKEKSNNNSDSKASNNSNTNSSSSSASSSNSGNEQSSAASDSNVLNSRNAGLDNYSEKSRGTSDKNNEVENSSNNANNSSQQKGFSPETKVNGKPAENSNKAVNGNSNTSSKASPETMSNSQSSSNGISSNDLSNKADSSVDSKNSGSVLNSSGQNTNSDAGGRTNSGSSSPSGGSGSVRSSGVSTSGSEADTSKSTLRGDSRSSQKGFSPGTKVNGKPVENKSSLSNKIQNTAEKMQNILNKTNAIIPEDEHPKGGIQARIE